MFRHRIDRSIICGCYQQMAIAFRNETLNYKQIIVKVLVDVA
jgi:hypothetical protein